MIFYDVSRSPKWIQKGINKFLFLPYKEALFLYRVLIKIIHVSVVAYGAYGPYLENHMVNGYTSPVSSATLCQRLCHYYLA